MRTHHAEWERSFPRKQRVLRGEETRAITEGTGKGAGTGPPRTEEGERPCSKEVAPKSGDDPPTAQERARMREQKQEKVEAERPLLDKAKDRLRGHR